MGDWRFRSDWPEWEHGKAPPGTTHGSDISVMFHGGSTARGNLFSSVIWGLVTAAIVHGRVPQSDFDTRYRLEWTKQPGIRHIDHSYLSLVEPSATPTPEKQA